MAVEGVTLCGGQRGRNNCATLDTDFHFPRFAFHPTRAAISAMSTLLWSAVDEVISLMVEDHLGADTGDCAVRESRLGDVPSHVFNIDVADDGELAVECRLDDALAEDGTCQERLGTPANCCSFALPAFQAALYGSGIPPFPPVPPCRPRSPSSTPRPGG